MNQHADMARRTDGQPRPKELRIVLVGRTGAGKSAAGNTILRTEEFVSKFCFDGVTKKCAKESAKVKHRKVAVIDTPGLFDTKIDNDEVIEEIMKCICLSAPGPHAILVVIQLGRFTQEEQDTVEMIQKIFGDDSAKYTIVLFTHGDKLEGKEIKDSLDGNGKLSEFIRLCGGRYHVFNNKDKDPSQVLELIKKIDKMVATNGGGCYTNEMFGKAEEAIQEQTKNNLENEKGISENEARERAEKDNSFLLPSVINSAFAVVAAGAGARAGKKVGAKLGAKAAARVAARVGARVGAMAGPVGAVVGAAVGIAAELIIASDVCTIQ